MSLTAARIKAAALSARFEAAGAVPVDCAVLQPAETLLDLYGEDIRTRAYVTSDPVLGEVMLRPDFTVPVVQTHMSDGAEPARYTYSGEVFRRQETHPERRSEFLQVGFELFDRTGPEAAEAEVFALFSDILSPYDARAVTGDIGFLLAAVTGLQTSERRKSALLRHIWRPKRFDSLLKRYSGRAEVPPTRSALLKDPDPMASAGVMIGLRSEDEIRMRIDALRADRADPDLSHHEVAQIETLLQVAAPCAQALPQLADLARDMPSIGPAVDRLARRCDALQARDVDVQTLAFDASYGRASMEYYDGFVFGFDDANGAVQPALASGGRYDALTRQLGQGREIPAVGGVIRPDLLAAMEATT